MEPVDITKNTEIELKALAFDLLQERAVIDQNLQTVQNEIRMRQASRPAEPEEGKGAIANRPEGGI